LTNIRQEVFNIISTERDYQDIRWPRPAHNHSVTEYLVYLDHYIKHAMELVSTTNGDYSALPDLRKIAALAVAAMEEHGVVERLTANSPDLTALKDNQIINVMDEGTTIMQMNNWAADLHDKSTAYNVTSR